MPTTDVMARIGRYTAHTLQAARKAGIDVGPRQADSVIEQEEPDTQ